VYGEILGNAAATGGPENATIPELAGNELSGTLGIGRQFGRNLFLSIGATYDNTHAVMLRPGFTLRVH
jgi:hypothetical protein